MLSEQNKLMMGATNLPPMISGVIGAEVTPQNADENVKHDERDTQGSDRAAPVTYTKHNSDGAVNPNRARRTVILTTRKTSITTVAQTG